MEFYEVYSEIIEIEKERLADAEHFISFHFKHGDTNIGENHKP